MSKTFSVKEVAAALGITTCGVVQRLNRNQLKGTRKTNQFGTPEWQVYATSNKALSKLIGASLPSADSLGRIVELMASDTIRAVIHKIYDQLKRNKALRPPSHGLMAVAIDGHETHATYDRHCGHCLERKVGTGEEKRIQYYHRNVTAMLVCDGFHFMLDADPTTK